MADGRLLGTIEKGKKERIEVRSREYEGHPFIDLRLFWLDQATKEWRPSQKGITVRPGQVTELIRILEKAKNGGDGDGPF